METKAILVLTVFMSVLLIPASSAAHQTNNSNTTLSTLSMTVNYTFDSASNKTQFVMGTEVINSSSTVTSSFQTTAQLPPKSSAAPTIRTTPEAKKSKEKKLIVLWIPLAIIAVALIVGFLETMRKGDLGQDKSVPRLLLGVRHRLRAAIGNLEHQMGLRLWPGGKTGGEDDEEAEGSQGEDGGQRMDDKGNGWGCRARNEGKGEDEDDSDSDDSSITEEDKPGESRREVEERKQSGNKYEEETSSESEGGQSAGEGESCGDKKVGSEEIALVSSPQEDDLKADLCDVTVL
ncbi:uncharacterized protein LOC127355355 [Dicentrarchus labrax]|uniref:uncharacterized protein LOC127355355 n=1 Tax=Dicentrarchus labrax TaxID=13489 RepID=UPI0021F60165|nr:uncharacterized protein LOC127355355 [Dicentrarchus labrax]